MNKKFRICPKCTHITIKLCWCTTQITIYLRIIHEGFDIYCSYYANLLCWKIIIFFSSFPETRVICIWSNNNAFTQKVYCRIWNLWRSHDFSVGWQSLWQAKSWRNLKCWGNKSNRRSLTSICWWRGDQALSLRCF